MITVHVAIYGDTEKDFYILGSIEAAIRAVSDKFTHGYPDEKPRPNDKIALFMTYWVEVLPELLEEEEEK